ncbi:MAG: hypothetical protein J1G38_02830 [Clostridiales bacterium]|nr:hypothetical protein [Clostridiales bacterium]
MSEIEEQDGAASARERFKRTLTEKAQAIKCVRNDVYTAKYWQLALNFVLGAGAVVLLIISFFKDGWVGTTCLLVALGAVVVVIVLNLAMRAFVPISFLQYTVLENGKRYCFQILGKQRSLFCDGEVAVEFDRFECIKREGELFPQYRFDFFKDMEPTVRIGKVDREIYKGRLECEGKTYRCKIVFKDGAPYYGVVNGARIKYFDVNSTKEKFYVPENLKKTAESFGVEFPKLPGLYVIESHDKATKQ